MTAPLERIKLILQTQASSSQLGTSKRSSYSGFLDAMIRVPQEQGFWSLWRGNFLNICRYFPAQAINFSCYDLYYDAYRYMIRPETAYSHHLLPFLAGGSVGVTSCTILYPFTFCNTRISVDVGDNKSIKREYYGLNDCIRKVYKSDGYRGLYQGLAFSACGMFLYRSTYFGVYTFGKLTYLSQGTPEIHSVQTPLLVSLFFAQLASVIATLITYPMETIARQKMLLSGRGLQSYESYRHMVGRITRNDGVFGLYRGMFAKLLTTVCGSLILVTYDLITDHYKKYKSKRFRRKLEDFKKSDER
ncbi:PREDICTED: ADP/ATP translocase 4-like [Dufourea novaeangliae]|uniref:ADP/ATP translocase 4-like n=1 Tax=Dufourea novaeangliae TaxID=178035 RepID=UPI000766F5A4|nr:PREDICTED: ADP/ATP translocase 4-like [Dufourea novaeangliae]